VGEGIVGFSDRLRAWLRGDDAPSGGRPSRPSGTPSGSHSADTPGDGSDAQDARAPRPDRRAGRRRGRSAHPSGSFDGSALLEFVRSRRGVEVYLEPRTNLYGDSVLLVADDGEYLRRPVPDATTVRRFCSEHGIPVYDAARTGYPRRVRDYDRGVRPRSIDLEDLPPWPGTVTDDARAEPSVDGDEQEPPPPPAPPAV